MNKEIEANKAWIASGAIGCVFASALVKNHEEIGWNFFNRTLTDGRQRFPDDESFTSSHIISLVFPDGDINTVRQWALRNGFYEKYIEELKDDKGKWYDLIGLRLSQGTNESWVQYLGPDSHVKTRQCPYPMLMWTQKLPAHIYAKTMIKGVFHLAHASIRLFPEKAAHTLWDRSFVQTEKINGHKSNQWNAAKVTFIKELE